MTKKLFFVITIFMAVFLSVGVFRSELLLWIEKIIHHQLNQQFWSVGLKQVGLSLLVLLTSLIVSRNLLIKMKWFKASGIIIVGYFIFLFINTINVPITDDYRTLLQFSSNFVSTDIFFQRCKLIADLCGDHRIILLRLVAIADLFLSGEVNLKHIIIFGNLFLIPLVWVLSNSCKTNKSLMFFIFSALVFQLGFYDAVGWATSMTYIWVSVFAATSFYFLSLDNKNSFILSIAFGILSVLSLENGILVIAINLLFLFSKNDWKKGLITLAFFSPVIIMVLFNRGTSLQLNLLEFNLKSFSFACCFLGSAFQFGYRTELPFAVGLLMMLLFVYAVYKKYYSQNFIVFATWMFIILSACVNAMFRLKFGFDACISNRYGFFSIIALISSLIFIIWEFNLNPFHQRIILCFCIVFQLSTTLFFYPEMHIRKQKLDLFIRNFKNQKPFVVAPPVIPENAEIILKEAIEKGVYKVPE